MKSQLSMMTFFTCFFIYSCRLALHAWCSYHLVLILWTVIFVHVLPSRFRLRQTTEHQLKNILFSKRSQVGTLMVAFQKRWIEKNRQLCYGEWCLCCKQTEIASNKPNTRAQNEMHLCFCVAKCKNIERTHSGWRSQFSAPALRFYCCFCWKSAREYDCTITRHQH